ncbi:hypothetical protein MUK42_31113 [Musa troglodytarum]|uniref:NDH-dependent cyclic electron flow 5 n=1 Tax=Musa troglodytarum TaxID=320322 RepID=A0A9E7K130_9LILI|nr:hypothetical protein MUK42_31113 [Musa troglodytarum]
MRLLFHSPAMASAAAIFPSSSPLLRASPLKHLGTFHQHLPFASLWRRRKRQISGTAALDSSISIPINVDYLETEFSGHGVTFEAIGDSCVVKMGLVNGSVASLMLPCGLITSYKPYMWHGSTFEVLHTTVSEGDGGAAVVRGGVSMDFKIGGDGSIPWSPSSWSLQSVRGSPEKSIQVELASVSPVDMAEVRCLVTLHQDLLGSELLISNTKSSRLRLTGSFISHLKVSTPDAAYAVGLQGSNYQSRQPFSSRFSMDPPDLGRRSPSTSKKPWTQNVLRRLLPGWGDTGEENEEELNEGGDAEESEGEEEDDYAHLTQKMSRIYTSAPRQFTIIDRGRRNSVVIRRSGFEELYVSSPGSEHEWHGKYAYICIGPAAQLTPLVLGPGETWRGAQYLHNPNL